MPQHDSSSDEALIEAIERGDRDAAACLYYRHVDRVHRICCRVVLDSSQAPDCVQEVWLKVFRHLGRFRPERSFVVWLNAVAANTAIDYYRRSKRHSKPAGVDTPDLESLPADASASHLSLPPSVLQHVRKFLGENVRTVGFWFGNVSCPGNVEASMGPWLLEFRIEPTRAADLSMGIKVTQEAPVSVVPATAVLSNSLQVKVGKPIIVGYTRDSYGTRTMGTMVILLEADASPAGEPQARNL